jgi:hypothetical protein
MLQAAEGFLPAGFRYPIILKLDIPFAHVPEHHNCLAYCHWRFLMLHAEEFGKKEA